ncbi:hypothetical protein GCM10028789_05640 [Sinomonas halotolerans]
MAPVAPLRSLLPVQPEFPLPPSPGFPLPLQPAPAPPRPPGFPLPHTGPWLAADLAARLGSSRAPARLVAQGLLVRISWGVYYSAPHWEVLPARERHLALMAAHHAMHARHGQPRFVYSHLSAARLHGLELWEPDELVHVTGCEPVAAKRRRGDARIHGSEVPPEQRTVVEGLPATSLERTVLDSARILRPGQAQIVVDHGLRLGARKRLLERMVDEAPGGRGIVTARRAVELGSALSESAGESLLNMVVAGMPVPRPQQQIEVVTRYGVHRIDSGWPSIRRGLELDGKKKYFEYAPTEEVVFKERQREKLLMEDEWRFLRLEWKDVFRPDELQRRIERLIASAGPAGIAMLEEARCAGR